MSDDNPTESGEHSPFDGQDGGSDAERARAEASDEASGDNAPLSDLARRVGRKRRDRDDGDADDSADSSPGADIDPELSTGSPPDPDEDPFEQMSVGEIDEETLWSSLGSDDTAGVGADTASDAEPGSPGDVGPASGVGSVGDAGDAGSKLPEHVVPKDTYCQSCPYLDGPPALACTHEGTEIVEVVDNERFRVRNCPMVEDGVEPTE
ncbi:hypothetical protein GCM10008995_15110 [Halobellus salinus]|uniref:DUF8135 domain-containing protein n=1 Tax=Halobellus salinus TaxID=931585 RepID=A0A830ESR1_9EURY|nr:hypothetical protein [Halobellus salinus]GGJ06180.1 hypothetical protein GCM10008995_15110 [Halobellus salinus]SMP14431.1 hypothetical protein SAMN06265347_10515 [Halobellus salinus]